MNNLHSIDVDSLACSTTSGAPRHALVAPPNDGELMPDLSKNVSGDADAVRVHCAHRHIRYGLFVSLHLTTGMLEAFSLMFLGGVFTSYATGSLVLLGIAIAQPPQAQEPDLLSQRITPPLLAFTAFCAGSYCAGHVRRMWPKDAALRPAQRLLMCQIMFLMPEIFIAAIVGLERTNVQWIVIVLQSFAGAFSMAASISLHLKDLPIPLVTPIVHRLFANNPFCAAKWSEILRPSAVVLALLIGGIAGSAIGRSGLPWIIVLLGCSISLVAVSLIEVVFRRACCDSHAGE